MGNVEGIKSEIMYQSASSDVKPQHSNCLKGEHFWCQYNATVAKQHLYIQQT